MTAPGATFAISNGHVLLDEEDVGWASQWTWRIESRRGYARRATRVENRRVNIYLHVAVLERKLGRPVEAGMVSDHLNGDRKDNRRANLREATPRENSINLRKRDGRYRGVFKHRQADRFEAKLGCGERKPNGRSRVISLGLYATDVEAAAAVDVKLDELGWVTPRNFSSIEERSRLLAAIESERAARGPSRDLGRIRALLAGNLPSVARRAA